MQLATQPKKNKNQELHKKGEKKEVHGGGIQVYTKVEMSSQSTKV